MLASARVQTAVYQLMSVDYGSRQQEEYKCGFMQNNIKGLEPARLPLWAALSSLAVYYYYYCGRL